MLAEKTGIHSHVAPFPQTKEVPAVDEQVAAVLTPGGDASKADLVCFRPMYDTSRPETVVLDLPSNELP